MDRVNEKLLRSQTGHIIAWDRQRIQEAQIAAFGGLLPERVAG